jgi:hypothetical protein
VTCDASVQTEGNLKESALGHKITLTLDRWLRHRYTQALPGSVAIVANISDASSVVNFVAGDNAYRLFLKTQQPVRVGGQLASP